MDANEALEAAAKIAEAMIPCPPPPWDCLAPRTGWQRHRQPWEAAAAIRAMKTPHSAGGD